MTRLSIILVYIYQVIFSPDHSILCKNHIRTCRFFPSCSEYTIDALQQYGFIRGWWFGMMRIIRCHPWQKGGWDPIKNHKLRSMNHGKK